MRLSRGRVFPAEKQQNKGTGCPEPGALRMIRGTMLLVWEVVKAGRAEERALAFLWGAWQPWSFLSRKEHSLTQFLKESLCVCKMNCPGSIREGVTQ